MKTRRRALALIPLICSASALVGCGKHSTGATFTLLNIPEDDGVYTWDCTVPSDAKQLDPTPIVVRVVDHANRPLVGCTGTATLTMPSMPMPSNTVPLIEQAPGIYHGVGRFTMAGAWRIHIDLRRGPKKMAAEDFDVTIH